MKLFTDIKSPSRYQEDRLNRLKGLDIEIIDEITDDVDLILVSRWQDAYWTKNLKAVFVPYTGYNMFPVSQLTQAQIPIFNTHAKSAIVAERAFAMTLSLLGKLRPYHQALLRGQWSTRENWGDEYWYSLHGKSCGIIGMGHIGRHLRDYLKPFGCTIVNLKRDREKKLGDYYSDTVEELIMLSDIIYITCPLTEATRNLINMDNIVLLKDKWLINVARGGIVSEEALYHGLSEGILRGAGIDVWYQYPKEGPTTPSQYDMTFDHLVMSPHAASHALEYKDAYDEDIFNQLEAFLEVVK